MQEERAGVMAALAALETFASELVNFGVPERLQRPIVRLAWKTARSGISLEENGGDHALLAAEESALAEVGAIVIAAAIEAEASKSGRPSPAVGGKGTGGKGVQWKRLCWRVEACARAAAVAGAAPERCGAVQRFGFVLLDRYRNDLGGPPALGKGIVTATAGPVTKASAPTRSKEEAGEDPAARLWVLPRDGAAWHGPVTAKEVLRLAEAGQLAFDASIWGLKAEQQGLQPEIKGSQPLGQSFPALGMQARKDSEVAVRQRDV